MDLQHNSISVYMTGILMQFITGHLEIGKMKYDDTGIERYHSFT